MRIRFLFTIDSILIKKILSADHRGISKFLDKYNQSSFKIYYFFSLLLEENHLALLVFDMLTKQIIYFDSLYDIKKNQSTIKNIVSTLAKYIKVLNESPNWKLSQNILAPKQSGSVDCGVYICQYAKFFGLNKKFDFNHDDIQIKRTEMANEILKFEIDSNLAIV